MKQLKALFKKEWHTNRFTLLLPVYATLFIYLAVGIAIIVAWSQGVKPIMVMRDVETGTGAKTMGLFIMVFGTTLMTSFISVISAIAIGDNVLNGDARHKCEILHSSQPVPFPLLSGSKFAFMSLGPILVLGVVSLVNSMVISTFFSAVYGAQFGMGLVSWLQTWLQMGLQILLIGSFCWLFGAIFKQRSFLMMGLMIIVMEILILTLNSIFGWHIGSLSGFLLSKVLTIDLGFNDLAITLDYKDQMWDFVNSGWGRIFSWSNLLKLGYSLAFGVAEALIYRERELK